MAPRRPEQPGGRGDLRRQVDEQAALQQYAVPRIVAAAEDWRRSRARLAAELGAGRAAGLPTTELARLTGLRRQLIDVLLVEPAEQLTDDGLDDAD